MSDDTNENVKIKVDEEMVTLADLAGISLDDVTELRGESFPKGVFLWEVDRETPPHLAVVGEGDKAKGAIVAKFKCLEVVGVTDSEFTNPPDSLIGKIHQETFFLTSLEGLGYAKAFFKDIGAPYNPALKTFLFNSAGTRFQAPIGKRKDKNDSDKIYTNLVRGKIKPVAA